MSLKIKWRVSPEPTGRYRSFENRAWPQAEYANGQPCAWILCEDEYYPPDVREGRHRPLTVRVADHSRPEGWMWRTLKTRRTTLADAKAAVEQFLTSNPTWIPKGEL